ncbi:uncharacterized protein PV09_04942 [Verruconis gallopava]|uniref:Uncharacterized protein n=1 Tax=Verruconis gallopava TaxID=253628 RepID=A0A0D2AYA3_9PEZI|nr:uncharacterized protein PV09_04942 [Verruconis gallopava]KIW04134.1 hypothetical protein PV09_04942 [Verruconis gallopava]
MGDTSAPTPSTMSVVSNKSRDTHREAKAMPYRLRQAVAVYLENKQFLEGFTLLNSILATGRSAPSAPPVYVPPTSYFELAATLVVHPLYTTRARSDEDLRVADEALRYLRDTCTVVGPVQAQLATAFQFRGARAMRRKRKREAFDEACASNVSTSGDDEDEDEDEGQLRTPFAGEKSVFRQRGADSFWNVVGWAFNCSVRWRKRWERWRLWLEVMIDILEHDFVLRLQAIDVEDATAQVWTKLAHEALIAQYLDGAGGRAGRRKVISAILADGEEKALREFGEVWKNETKERKVKDEASLWDRNKKINLDENEWADYAATEDEDDVVEDGDDDTFDAGENAEPDLGGLESMRLRQRLMILASFALP